jgi:Matrixin/Putative peptidoglycan binding domain
MIYLRPKFSESKSPLKAALERLANDVTTADLFRVGRSDDLSQVAELLSVFGFAEGNGTGPENLAAGIRNFQLFYGISPITGELNSATLEVMKRGRCRHLDFRILDEGFEDCDQKIELTGLCHWGKRKLTYAFDVETLRIPGLLEFDFVNDAAKDWNDLGEVTLQKINSVTDADVVVGWRSRDEHPGAFAGDAIAHADFPGTCSIFRGNKFPIHFNDNVDWGLGAGYDVRSVARHEFGHILGFPDVNNCSSVMYHTFSDGIPGNAISPDDFQALQSLYRAVPRIL